MKGLILFAAICIAVTSIPCTLLSAGLVTPPAIQKDRANFIASALSKGAPEQQIMLIWESYVSSNHGTDIMAALFHIFTEAIEEINEDKAYWIQKLKDQNDISESLGDYLKDLNEQMDASSSSGTPPKLTKTATIAKKTSNTHESKRAKYILDMVIKMSKKSDD